MEFTIKLETEEEISQFAGLLRYVNPDDNGTREDEDEYAKAWVVVYDKMKAGFEEAQTGK